MNIEKPSLLKWFALALFLLVWIFGLHLIWTRLVMRPPHVESTVPTAPYIAYVSKSGDDAKGEVNNPKRPFATIHTAIDRLNALYDKTHPTNMLVSVGGGEFDEGTNKWNTFSGLTVQGSKQKPYTTVK